MQARVFSLSAAVLTGWLLAQLAEPMVWGQAVKNAPEAKAAKAERRGPLPFYFGKLGLSDVQKNAIYTAQEDYEKKLAPLRDQLKLLVKERDQKLEEFLTAGQKLRLEELRAAAKARGAKPDADADTPSTK